MYKKEQKNDENFWISYADLMAGLLFVFILVLGAIVIKYIYTQNILQQEQESLNSAENQNSKLFAELAKAKNLYETTKDDLEKSNAQINLKLSEIEKLKALLLEYDLKIKDEEEKNLSLQEELKNSLEEKTNQISLKDEELKLLADKLLVQTQIHQKLVEDFDIAKLKIKTLTGLKLNVIASLKEKLGNSIQIDEHSGNIKFSSNILFDQASSQIKEESKEELKKSLKNYFKALLEDDKIKDQIESIIIEGHTNSDGNYLSNLALSQNRAQNLMNFIYESNIIDKTLLSKYLQASGRSDSNRIFAKDGTEDKDASRRIEIKFNLKNEEAIKEIQNYLEKNSKQENIKDKKED